MLGNKPRLQLVRTNHIADQQVVGAVVASVGGFLGHSARFFEDELVRFQQPRNLHGHFLAAARRPGNHRCFGNIGRHRNAYAAKKLNALSDGIDQLALLVVVLVEKQVELIKRVSCDLPMMLLVHVAQRHGIREDLVQVADALGAYFFVEGNGHGRQFSVWLNFTRLLMQDGTCAVGAGLKLLVGFADGAMVSGTHKVPPRKESSALSGSLDLADTSASVRHRFDCPAQQKDTVRILLKNSCACAEEITEQKMSANFCG